jgi:hypothetical protein
VLCSKVFYPLPGLQLSILKENAAGHRSELSELDTTSNHTTLYLDAMVTITGAETRDVRFPVRKHHDRGTHRTAADVTS